MNTCSDYNPTYIKIANELKSFVVSGIWKPGDRIASEKELAEKFVVSGATIKKSFKFLEKEGLIWGKSGKGRFVSDIRLRKKTWGIGIVLYDMNFLTHPVMVKKMEGIRDVVEASKRHLQIFNINTSVDSRQISEGNFSWMGRAEPSNVIDGALVWSRLSGWDSVSKLAEKVPVVWMERASVGPGTLGVRFDILGGAYAAGRHLVELGHRRIGIVTVDDSWSAGLEQREGVRLSLSDIITTQGSKFYAFTITDFKVEEGLRVGRELVKMPKSERPTAIVSGSDELALGLYQAFAEVGWNIPKDISLIGWNDTLALSDIPVSMTTVRPDYYQLGAKGAENLLWMIDHPGKFRETSVIDSKLLVRESTAPLNTFS